MSIVAMRHLQFLFLICKILVVIPSCFVYVTCMMNKVAINCTHSRPTINQMILEEQQLRRQNKINKTLAHMYNQRRSRYARIECHVKTLKDHIFQVKSDSKTSSRLSTQCDFYSEPSSENRNGSSMTMWLPIKNFEKLKTLNYDELDKFSINDLVLKQNYSQSPVCLNKKEMACVDALDDTCSLSLSFMMKGMSSCDLFDIPEGVQLAFTKQNSFAVKSDKKMTALTGWFNGKVVAITDTEVGALEKRLCKSQIKATTADAHIQNALALLRKSSLAEFHPSSFQKSVHNITASQGEVMMKMVKELAMDFVTNFRQTVSQFSYAILENRTCFIEIKFWPLMGLTVDECVDCNDKPPTSGSGTSRTQSRENSGNSQHPNTIVQGSNQASNCGGTGGNGGDKPPSRREKIPRGCEGSETPDVPLNEQEDSSSESISDSDDDQSDLPGQNNIGQVADEQLFDMSFALPSVRKLDDPTVGERPLRPSHEASNVNIGAQLNGMPGRTVKGLVQTVEQICLPGVDNQPEDLVRSDQNANHNSQSEREATAQSSENEDIDRSHSQTSPSSSHMVANQLEAHRQQTAKANVPAQRFAPSANYSENAIQSQNSLGGLVAPSYHPRNENLANIPGSAAGPSNTPPVSPSPESDIRFSLVKNANLIPDEERLARMASHNELVNIQTRRSSNVIVEDPAAPPGINTPDLLSPNLVQRNQNLTVITLQSTQNLADEENILNAESQLEGTAEMQTPEHSPLPSFEESTTPANPALVLQVEEAQSSQERRSLQSTSSSIQSANFLSASTHLNENMPQRDAFCLTSETSNIVEARQLPIQPSSLEENFQANDDPPGRIVQECTVQNTSQQESSDEEPELLPTRSLGESSTTSANFVLDATTEEVGARQHQDAPPEVFNPDDEESLQPPGPSLTQLPNSQRDYWELHFISPPRRPPESLREFDRILNASYQVQRMDEAQENITRNSIQGSLLHVDAEIERCAFETTLHEVRRREHRHGNNAIQGNTPLLHVGTEPPSHDALPPYLVDAEPEPLPLDATPLNDEPIEEQPQIAEERQPPGPSIYVLPWTAEVRSELASEATFRIAIPETTSRSNDAIPIAPLQESQMQSQNPSPVVGIVNQPNPRLARTFIDPPPRLDRTFHHAPFHQGREMRRCLHCDAFFICLALMVCEICGLPWCAACDNHRQDEARVHPDDEVQNDRSFGDEET